MKEERFRVLQENGYGEVERQIREKEEMGYTIKRIEKGVVPFCEGPDGEPVMVPGWSIVTEPPKPRNKTAYDDCASVNPNLQDPPRAGGESAYPTPWLW